MVYTKTIDITLTVVSLSLIASIYLYTIRKVLYEAGKFQPAIPRPAERKNKEKLAWNSYFRSMKSMIPSIQLWKGRRVSESLHSPSSVSVHLSDDVDGGFQLIQMEPIAQQPRTLTPRGSLERDTKGLWVEGPEEGMELRDGEHVRVEDVV